MSALAANVRAYRERRGLTLKKLASAADVGARTILGIEHGASPSVATLEALAKALGVKAADLLAEPAAPKRAAGGGAR